MKELGKIWLETEKSEMVTVHRFGGSRRDRAPVPGEGRLRKEAGTVQVTRDVSMSLY